MMDQVGFAPSVARQEQGEMESPEANPLPSGMLFFASSKPSKGPTNADNANVRGEESTVERSNATETTYSEFMLGHPGRIQNFFSEPGEGSSNRNIDGQVADTSQEGTSSMRSSEERGEYSYQNPEGMMVSGLSMDGTPDSPQGIVTVNTSSLGPGETTTIDGVTYNSRGYEVCGQLNQHSKPCQRIGRCPFHGAKKPNPMGKSRRHAVKKAPYKQGWTKEEHLRFLHGLQVHGKGAWKEIANIVGTRTPTQIQSHAQKYYLRQKQQVKNKRSIHDVSLNDLIKEDPNTQNTSFSARKTETKNSSKARSSTESPSSPRVKGRRSGGNLPFTSHMFLQPAPSSLAVSSGAVGSSAVHPSSTMAASSSELSHSGASSFPPSSTPMASRSGGPASPGYIHQQSQQQTSAASTQQPRPASPFGLSARRAQSASPHHFQSTSTPAHFRPQTFAPYPPSMPNQPNTMLPPAAVPVPISIPIPSPSSSSPPPSRPYQPSYPSAHAGNSDELLLAPMTAAFTPYMRPSNRTERAGAGSGNGGGYIMPVPRTTDAVNVNSNNNSNSMHRPVPPQGMEEDDMVELELEMLRARGRRLATPPPNTFQPIVSAGGHSTVGSYPNVLLRPVHSPVPNIPPGSRLPPMSSTPPPSLLALQQQQHHHNINTSSAPRPDFFPATRTMLGNPYTSPAASVPPSTFPLLGVSEAHSSASFPFSASSTPPSSLSSPPLSTSSLLCGSGVSSLTPSSSPSISSTTLSPCTQALCSSPLPSPTVDSVKPQAHPLVLHGSTNDKPNDNDNDNNGNSSNNSSNKMQLLPFPMASYGGSTRDSLGLIQPAMTGSPTGYLSPPSDFLPLSPGSHPGRDSAEPMEDHSLQPLLHNPAEVVGRKSGEDNDTDLNVPHLMGLEDRSSFSIHHADDSEDEHVSEKGAGTSENFLKRKEPAAADTLYPAERLATFGPDNAAAAQEGEPSIKRAKLIDAPDEEQDDTSHYFE